MSCLARQVGWDVKSQLQALRRSKGHRRWLELGDPLVDVRIAAWLHKPDSNTTVSSLSRRPRSRRCHLCVDHSHHEAPASTSGAEQCAMTPGPPFFRVWGLRV